MKWFLFWNFSLNHIKFVFIEVCTSGKRCRQLTQLSVGVAVCVEFRSHNFTWNSFVWLFSPLLFCCLANNLGAVFENNTFYNEGISMLQYAAAEANDKILPNSGMEIAIEVQTIAYGREYAVSKRVCSLLEVIKPFADHISSSPKEMSNH